MLPEDIVRTPKLAAEASSQLGSICYPIAAGHGPTALQSAMKAQGVPTAIYYPRPMHTQLSISVIR